MSDDHSMILDVFNVFYLQPKIQSLANLFGKKKKKKKNCVENVT